MNRTVYIETTIVSYLTARRSRDPLVAGQQSLTREWWADERRAFELFASELVFTEAAAGDVVAAAERLAILGELPLLQVSDEAHALAASLIDEMALPVTADRDALHVGIAAVNGMDYLLTWNCRHLANAVLRPRIEQVCRDAGFEPPIVCTPQELRTVSP